MRALRKERILILLTLLLVERSNNSIPRLSLLLLDCWFVNLRCGTPDGCQCSEICISGRCKVREQHPLFHYNHLKSLVLCPKVAIPQHESDEDEQYNHTDHKRACVEGTCHECGVWDAEEGNYRGGGSNSSNGNSTSSNSPEHFVLPKAWTEQLLAEIKRDEDTIPHDLLLWEAR